MSQHRLVAGAALTVLVCLTAGCQATHMSLQDPARTEFRAPSTDLAPYSGWDRITEGDIGEDRYPMPLSTGSGLIFASNRHSEFFKLYLREAQGRRVRRLTHGGGHDAFPAVSPDGTQIAFASTRNGVWQLYVQNGYEDRDPIRLGEPGIDARHPAWSPDGKQIAYCRLSPVSKQWEIWILDLESQSPIRVTEGLFPAFSPDGKTIAFQRHRRRDGRWFSIWTIATDGTREHEIVAGDEWGAVNPCWSPDGTRIAFNSVGRSGDTVDRTAVDPGTDLYVVHADGTRLQRITFRDGPEWNPTWGLDGKLYFNATVDGETALWSVTAPRTPRP